MTHPTPSCWGRDKVAEEASGSLSANEEELCCSKECTDIPPVYNFDVG